MFAEHLAFGGEKNRSGDSEASFDFWVRIPLSPALREAPLLDRHPDLPEGKRDPDPGRGATTRGRMLEAQPPPAMASSQAFKAPRAGTSKSCICGASGVRRREEQIGGRRSVFRLLGANSAVSSIARSPPPGSAPRPPRREAGPRPRRGATTRGRMPEAQPLAATARTQASRALRAGPGQSWICGASGGPRR